MITITKEKLIKMVGIDEKWLQNIKDDIFTTKQEKLPSINECINLSSSPATENEDETMKLIFKAIAICKTQDVKVLILGQDPYPDKVDKFGRRAHGLAFSFQNEKGINEPADASLLNIFKAIKAYKTNEKFYDISDTDIKGTKDNDGWNTNLETWATSKGILLLNTALTYCDEIKKEDRVTIWKPFVEKIIENLLIKNENGKLVVFLWGDTAQTAFHNAIYNNRKDNKRDIIADLRRNLLVLSTSHPSNSGQAVKRGFCYEAPNHFKACDMFLFGEDEKNYIWKNFPEK